MSASVSHTILGGSANDTVSKEAEVPYSPRATRTCGIATTMAIATTTETVFATSAIGMVTIAIFAQSNGAAAIAIFHAPTTRE